MKKIGLALSGGGFRASLYHLGLVRFLRDAGILPQVTHITSVSGGSIFAAHLVLNWGRYNGSASEFDAAAAEFLSVVQLDVRNRITRRFPLAFPWRWLRRVIGLSNRKLTRTGLLEMHYEKFLYGDVSLFELPEKPQLHILATNVSEGCLCSFNRNGLLMVRRHAGHTFRIDPVQVGLATVAMAVTASSAFPGFFPPLELTAADVGAKSGEFGRQAYTDGGVFDNLGVRMFRCLEPVLLADQSELDGVLVSDVGKRIEVQASGAGGLIRTALRATDILMDRVWQLENETFKDTPGFVFARINDVVEHAEDPTALHPEIQRQVANIRTDIDRFSPLEISSLIQHGYCVGRKACRAKPELFGTDAPADAPWDPISARRSAAPSLPATPRTAISAAPWGKGGGAKEQPAEVTIAARTLQKSAGRRIWRTLLDYRDWVSYVYVPILVPMLFLTPYLVVKSYQRSARYNHLMESLSHGSRDLEVMTALLEGPMTPWVGEVAEDIRGLDEPDYKGFEVLQDSRIIDMRTWNPTASGKNEAESLVYGYRRLKIRKLPENTSKSLFRIGVLATNPKTQIRYPPQELQPRLRMRSVDGAAAGQKKSRFECSIDFSKVPAGDFVDVIYEHISAGDFLERGERSTTLVIHHQVDTAEVTRWFLMPRGREYKGFRILRHETGKQEKMELVKTVTEYLADDSSILAYKLVSVKAGYTYELTWYYK